GTDAAVASVPTTPEAITAPPVAPVRTGGNSRAASDYAAEDALLRLIPQGAPRTCSNSSPRQWDAISCCGFNGVGLRGLWRYSQPSPQKLPTSSGHHARRHSHDLDFRRRSTGLRPVLPCS